MARRLDVLRARRRMYREAQDRLMAALPLDPTSSEGRLLQFEVDSLSLRIAAVDDEIDLVLNTGQGSAPADPATLKRIQEATAALHQLNVTDRGARDVLAIVTSILASAGSGAGSAPGASVAPATMAFTPLDETPSVALRDGRYGGGTDLFRLDLRVDAAVSGLVSCDVFARAGGDTSVWIVSFRTQPGEAIANASGSLRVFATDRNGATSTGRLALRPDSDDLRFELVLDAPLEGMPWGRRVLAALTWQDAALRRLGMEIEQEKNVELPAATSFGGAPMTLQQALANAGIETWSAGRANELPPPPAMRPGDDQNGWSEKDLDGLMREAAQTRLDAPAFELRLLWLSRSNRRGLLGIMFDSEDALQRQGVAVFADEIRRVVGEADAPRKLIQTAVHEIGHALNLAHRFERVVGRADSTSFMNYDWRYRGGDHSDEFWRRFSFAFDEDELAFLRHGPLPALVPGGNAFHSARYWADGKGGYSPYLNEVPLPGVKLEIVRPPGSGVPIFEFGQPVILGLRFTNEGTRPIAVPSYLLDAKAGLLEVTIRKLDMADRDRRDVRSFTPIVTRCFDVATDETRVLQPGQSFEDNLNLCFGAAGFPFADVGFYEVAAHVVIYQPSQGRELVAPSQPVRIRVAAPHSADDERDATVLLTPAAGRYFALGGTQSPIESALEEVVARRARREHGAAGKAAARPTRDPIAANILRAKAFRQGRHYHRYVDGNAKLDQKADLAAARETLRQISLDAFDPITAAATRRFAGKPKA